MSHRQLRTESNCLNCGHEVEERYCTHCGQENLEIQHSAIHLIIHYVQDLFHYDGKVWNTLKNLLLKPGLPAKEYMAGKRMRNLEPVRLYVFASTVFFLILFFEVDFNKLNPDVEPELNYERRLFGLNQERKFLKDEIDTVHIHTLMQHLQMKLDSMNKINQDSGGNHVEFDFSTPVTDDLDSSSWLVKIIGERMEARRAKLEKQHQGDTLSAAEAFFDEVFHKLPLLFFLSMPFFALFLKILYFRSFRKRYVEHFIFSVYHYAYLFMITSLYLIFQYGLQKINGRLSDNMEGWTGTVFTVYVCIYLWLSMARFYEDRWFKRFIKFLMLMFLLVVTLLLLFFLIFFLTIIT